MGVMILFDIVVGNYFIIYTVGVGWNKGRGVGKQESPSEKQGTN